MRIQSVLVEREDIAATKIYCNSGLLFATKYVILTSNILSEILKDNVTNFNSLRDSANTNIRDIKTLITSEIKFKVVRNQNNIKTFEDFYLIAYFVSQDIKNSVTKLLFDWSIDDKQNGKAVLQQLSIFLVLQKDSPKWNLNDLTMNILTLFELSMEGKRLHTIYIESCPFGNRNFLDSHSEGIVSNVIGVNNCLLLIDCSTVPGCEGGVIFKKQNTPQERILVKEDKKIPIGIVLSSYNIWKGDYLGLTVGASLPSLLSPLVANSPNTVKCRNTYSINNNLYRSLFASVVLIKTPDSWGSAILFNLEKGLFLSNSHIVEKNLYAQMHWKDIQFTCQVLYRTPNDQIFDLAILQCTAADIKKLVQSQLQPAIINGQKVFKGEPVVAVGYPLFDAHQHNLATMTSGHVMAASDATLHTSCTVLPGSSGGGIFSLVDGRLVGVVVCNTRMEGVNYANVNIAVPVSTIAHTLDEFTRDGDIGGLERLCRNDERICREWRFTSSKL